MKWWINLGQNDAHLLKQVVEGFRKSLANMVLEGAKLELQGLPVQRARVASVDAARRRSRLAASTKRRCWP